MLGQVALGLSIVFLSFVVSVLLYNLLCWLIPGPKRQSKLELKDRTVLITGASSGIGRALAEEFYTRGAKVIVASRNIAKLNELCEELESRRTKGDALHKPEYCELDLEDLKDDERIEAVTRKLLSHSLDGRTIDVLVNNAGLTSYGSCKKTPIKVHRRLMEVNFFGHVILTRALLDNIPDAGAIVTISSILGRVAIPYQGVYSASKHALQAFMDAMRGEERPNLQILTVSPGYVNSGMELRAVMPSGDPAGGDNPNNLKGYTTQYTAKEILKAVVNRETELLLAPFLPRVTLTLRLFTPNFLWWVLHRRAANEYCPEKK